MSTFNGFGTLYYGWRHDQDGTATATKWISLFYLPVFPLERHELKVLTDFGSDPVRVKTIGGGLFGFVASQVNHFSVLRKTSLAPAEIIATFVKTYIFLPILMIWPIALMILLAKIFGPVQDNQAVNFAAMVASALTLFSALAWPIWAIRRSRGKRV